jgi:hypothetical protein
MATKKRYLTGEQRLILEENGEMRGQLAGGAR